MPAWKAPWLGLSFPNQPSVRRYLLNTYYVLGQDCGLRSHTGLESKLHPFPAVWSDTFLKLKELRLFTFKMGLVLGPGASQVVLEVKNLPANAGDIRDVDLISGLERSPGGGHGNPLQ